MTFRNNVVVFGDQTVDPCPLIKQLYRQSTGSPTLQVFFRRTCDALRQELATSQPSDRSTFPNFDSIIALAETYSRVGKPEEAVSTVLLCISQLGLLLT